MKKNHYLGKFVKVNNYVFSSGKSYAVYAINQGLDKLIGTLDWHTKEHEYVFTPLNDYEIVLGIGILKDISRIMLKISRK